MRTPEVGGGGNNQPLNFDWLAHSCWFQDDSFQDVDEVKFVEEPVDINHECLVCLQLLREPWIVECCGHHLCKPCIDKVIRDKNGCPHCRTARFRHMRDKNHERILLGKQVYCKYKSKGCGWQGTLRELDQHCSARHCCEWCQELFQCYEENEHQRTCTVANEVIDCELKPFGCSEKVSRRNISRHMQDYCREHIELVKQAYEKSSSKNIFLAKKVDLLEKKRIQFRKEKETELIEVGASYHLLEDRLQTEKNKTKKKNMALWQILQGSHTEYPEGDDQFLIDALLDKENRYQVLKIELDDLRREIRVTSEEVQRLRIQAQRYKCTIGLSILIMLLVGIFLQYLFPVIFVELVLPAIVLSILFFSICACYVYFSYLYPS